MALMLDIKVVPQSGKSYCVLGPMGGLKCYVRGAAEKGKANAELINLLAHALALPQKDIGIVLGATSRNKRIKIDADLSREQVYAALGIMVQQSLL